MSYQKTDFGRIKSGENTVLYTFQNASGMQMRVTDFGAILVSVIVKDKEGKELDVVQGYESAAEYEADTLFMGAVIGRCTNRIKGAVFELNGKTYELHKNDNGNCLHSGPDFYGKRIWKVEEVENNSITFSMFSPHMDQGYPGNVTIYVTYTLNDENEIQIEYKASPDMDTLLNMTNHSYFNLDGHDAGSVLRQKVWIDADVYTEADAESIPTGRLLPVKDTPMDFCTPKEIGRDIGADYEALKFGQGYDHNFVVNGEGYRKTASLESEESGIKMSVYTDCPGMQFYTANFLSGEKGKGGAVYERRSSACFEAQFFPDAVHHKNFEGPVCKAGETYCQRTGYRFEICGK